MGRQTSRTMSTNHGRRRFLGAVAASAAAARVGRVRAATAEAPPAHAQPGRSAALLAGELRQIEAGDLVVGYADVGPPGAVPVVLLHGWPYDIQSYAEVSSILVSSGLRVLVPYLRGYGTTRFRSAGVRRNGQQAALAVDLLAFMDSLGIRKAVLGGFDWGARTVNIAAALWPERCLGMASVSGYLIGSQAANRAPLPPPAELAWWYQYYFATERGRDGYRAHTRDFARLIWRTASPRWDFDEATFDRSAASFLNPDHVEIVVHNYRWRLGLAEGEPRFDALEATLATGPRITVPTITLEGDANGAPHPDPQSYAAMFSGPYEHRQVGAGVGHNLPQEAPQAFAKAVLDLAARHDP